MTREECIARALEYVELKQYANAHASLTSDLMKRSDGSAGDADDLMEYSTLGMKILMKNPQDEAGIRAWIEAAP